MKVRRVSVVIPARNEARAIADVVAAVLAQQHPGLDVEVIVADDGSTDGTGSCAARAGARVLELGPGPGNPGAARNRGAAVSRGDPIVFLDADCIPAAGWLDILLAAHDAGDVVVGGSLAMAPGLPLSARLDYYASAYHVHPGQLPSYTRNHTPANLSVRRAVFLGTAGFTERFPVADGHEELAWQGEVLRAGQAIRFEPGAVALHHYRAGFRNVWRRNYRWAYSVIESKSGSTAVRAGWLYRRPALLVLASAPFSIAAGFYILGCWVRAGKLEPILLLPGLLAARCVYAAGMMAGGIAWLRGERGRAGRRPAWR